MLRRRPTPATVISLVALFVALGGTTYAAATIGSAQIKNNSIRGKDIRKSAVTTSDIKNNAVRSADVRNGSLQAGDFASGQLPAGATGPVGPKGDKGDKGDTGAPGATNVITRSKPDTIPANTAKIVNVACAEGERATGGGGNNVAARGVNVIQTAPEPLGNASTPTGWQVTWDNTTASAKGVTVYAICASP